MYLRYVPTLDGSNAVGTSNNVRAERTMIKNCYSATDEELARVETAMAQFSRLSET